MISMDWTLKIFNKQGITKVSDEVQFFGTTKATTNMLIITIRFTFLSFFCSQTQQATNGWNFDLKIDLKI